MKSITYAFQIQTSKADKVITGELSKVILKGASVFPVYGLNEDVLELLDDSNKPTGYIAVKSFNVKPSDDITIDESLAAGFESVEEVKSFLEDELITTVVEVIPVVDECDCEDCDCCGDCGGDCESCDNCKCKAEHQHA